MHANWRPPALQTALLHRTCMLARAVWSGDCLAVCQGSRLVIADIGCYEQIEAAPLRVQRVTRCAGAPCQFMHLWFLFPACLPG